MTDPVVAKKAPYEVAVKQGDENWWCACGQSKAQPFCDGSHKGTGFSPVQHVAKNDRTVYFCGCKRTSNKPLCDGSHSSL